MYAKLIEGILQEAPVYITVGNQHVWNAPASEYLAQGWYPVIYTDEPETDEDHYAVASWSQESDCIRQTWTVVERSDDEEIAYDEAGHILLGEEDE